MSLHAYTFWIGGRERSTGQPRRRHGRLRRWALIAAAAGAVNLLLIGGAAGAGVNRKPSVLVSISPAGVVSGRHLSAGHSASFKIAGSSTTHVPAAATAAQLAVTLIGDRAGGGWLDVYPAGGAPVAAAHWQAGQSLATELTVPIGTAGKVSLRARQHGVTVSAKITGYYIPASIAPGSVTNGDLAASGSTPGQVLTATSQGVVWQSPSTTYTAAPTNAQWKWNSQYVFETGPGSLTEYFTRYVTLSIPALTQATLDTGSVQVFMTPAPANVPSQWAPLPYHFDDFGGFAENFVYVTSPGQLTLHLYFIATSPGATLPTLSTYTVNTYQFKIVVTPGAAAATQLAPAAQQRAATTRPAQEICTAFPGGRHCRPAP